MSKTFSLLIAGTHSGCGKTTVAVGIMAALKKRGLAVQPFKVGPDFIDPGYHETVCNIPSINLDGWMLTKDYNLATFRNHCKNKDIAVIEGVMGLYDGQDGRSESGSTAQIAKWCNSPVLLVVDARSMARSAAALVYGFEQFDRQVNIAGVILNRVSSVKHYQGLKDAIEKRCKAKVIGHIPQRDTFTIPQRHLGLITSKENTLTRQTIKNITDIIESSFDVKSLLSIASPVDLRVGGGISSKHMRPTWTTPVTIAVAYDEAFCFYYHDNLELLKSWGAELHYFSPLRDHSLPTGITGIYLGGGYPELYARELESNRSMRDAIRMFALRGGIIYAECGGLMYLGSTLIDCESRPYNMAGVFPFTFRMGSRIAALGYYTVRTLKDTVVARKGSIIKGHQFRYSSLEGISSSCPRVYQIQRNSDGRYEREGFVFKNVLASYVHLHFGSHPECAQRLTELCREHREGYKKLSNRL